ncbi:Extracellular solute-binding protein, ABC transport component (plasmid) [Sodalis praecaptivus]|uniref:Extracellular solute-binding protein, ABC transport component n=1 Tax=Sodalis praecaptivus TaxID=1239307 RepID=W0HZC2_9GAMM|nr:ectoine/hydroxyectoine ABC transporter substrate-binding protein EhuB [Sodalis praecaptivus]AHF79191.1 Extracellular solute-binding protein, ABC transport component [Sodalis praecaptivus]
MKSSSTFSLAGVVSTVVLLGAVLALPASAQSLLDKAKSQEPLVAGIANEQPYGYIGPDGKATGANIEVLRAVLKPLGMTKIDTPIVDFGALVPGLAAKRFDVIGAGLFINHARCQVIGFSNPVTRSGGAFIVRKGNPLNLHSLKDVAANPQARLGTQNGTNQIQEAKDSGIATANVVLFDKDTEALAALKAKRIDAVYFPDAEIISLLKKEADPTVERALPFQQIPDAHGQPGYNYHAFGLPRNDRAFIDAFNAQLKALRASGELLKILQKYGYTANELPPEDIQASQLCATPGK